MYVHVYYYLSKQHISSSTTFNIFSGKGSSSGDSSQVPVTCSAALPCWCPPHPEVALGSLERDDSKHVFNLDRAGMKSTEKDYMVLFCDIYQICRYMYSVHVHKSLY